MTQTQIPMTPVEAYAAAKAMCASIGPRCVFNMSIYSDMLSTTKNPIWWRLEPIGWIDSSKATAWALSGNADTFEQALFDGREAYENSKEARDLDTVRNMALAIIRITIEQGQCTDVMLRADPAYKFDQAIIDRLGERAIVSANEMAQRGPFTIVFTKTSSNGAPADADDDMPF